MSSAAAFGKPYLGRYQLRQRLAVGGMAELYLADVKGAGGFQKQVVVKRVLPHLADDNTDVCEMFLDEARIAATLQHPNLVQVYDACEEDGEYFMAMEYLDGTDLRTLRTMLCERSMPLPWEHVLHIVQGVAAGLHYAHEKRGYGGESLGIVHRDVTPQNIFLTRDGGVKLVDFGIAKAEGYIRRTAVGALKGKLAYVSPEQCVGTEVDRRSDIYSLGIILYELSTGKRLYQGTTAAQLHQEVMESKILRPSTFMNYPEGLEEIVLRCLEKKPKRRFQTARDLQVVLENFARRYQLMCSTLSFSAFLEKILPSAVPLLPLAQGQRQSARGSVVQQLPVHPDTASTAKVSSDVLARLRAEEMILAKGSAVGESAPVDQDDFLYEFSGDTGGRSQPNTIARDSDAYEQVIIERADNPPVPIRISSSAAAVEPAFEAAYRTEDFQVVTPDLRSPSGRFVGWASEPSQVMLFIGCMALIFGIAVLVFGS